MIIRVFRSKCKIKGMEEFYRTEALPILSKQPGCLFAFAGRDAKKRPPEIIMVTVWKDLKSLRKFAGGDWKKPKVVPSEVPHLIGKQESLHFDCIGHYEKGKKLTLLTR